MLLILDGPHNHVWAKKDEIFDKVVKHKNFDNWQNLQWND